MRVIFKRIDHDVLKAIAYVALDGESEIRQLRIVEVAGHLSVGWKRRHGVDPYNIYRRHVPEWLSDAVLRAYLGDPLDPRPRAADKRVP
jgi:hypothetical protein